MDILVRKFLLEFRDTLTVTERLHQELHLVNVFGAYCLSKLPLRTQFQKLQLNTLMDVEPMDCHDR